MPASGSARVSRLITAKFRGQSGWRRVPPIQTTKAKPERIPNQNRGNRTRRWAYLLVHGVPVEREERGRWWLLWNDSQPHAACSAWFGGGSLSAPLKREEPARIAIHRRVFKHYRGVVGPKRLPCLIQEPLEHRVMNSREVAPPGTPPLLKERLDEEWTDLRNRPLEYALECDGIERRADPGAEFVIQPVPQVRLTQM
jgi:hypothetical protein